MGGFSELIKNFEKTRDYVRDFFIYGFKVRNDFGNKSSRTYDDEKRRIESWLGDYMSYENSKHGKQIAITVDSGHIYENPLYQAYYSKSFTDNDIKLHFFITDILYNGEILSLKEILERMNEFYGEFFEEQTVRNKLKEYVKEGVLITEKRGKTAYFGLSPDRLESIIEYEGMEDALRFFSCMPEFGETGNSIMKMSDIENNIFLIKHNYIAHTLDDIILTEILDSIEERKYISFQTISSKKTQQNVTKVIENIVPMQIFSSVQTGRRYMIGYNERQMRFYSYRLDQIKKVNSGEICLDYEEIQRRFKKTLKKCFGVSFYGGDEKKIEPLKITFKIDEETEAFVIDRIIKEKRNGIFEKIDKNTFLLTLDICDPNEAMHWVKTFIGRIISVEGGTETVRKRFYDDIERLYQIYGGNNDNI